MVHMVGGSCAFWGARILGERYGRKEYRERMKGIQDNGALSNLNLEDKEFKKILRHVKGDYRAAF